MTRERKARSLSYQYVMQEIPFGKASDMEKLLSNEPFFRDEFELELIETLRESLIKRTLQIASECLTPRQAQIAKLYYIDQLTQTEIGKELGIAQTSVHKIIAGNLYYDENFEEGKKRRYGGLLKRIRKSLATDEEANLILAELIKLDAFFPPKEFIAWLKVRKGI